MNVYAIQNVKFNNRSWLGIFDSEKEPLGVTFSVNIILKNQIIFIIGYLIRAEKISTFKIRRKLYFSNFLFLLNSRHILNDILLQFPFWFVSLITAFIAKLIFIVSGSHEFLQLWYVCCKIYNSIYLSRRIQINVIVSLIY